VLLDLLVPPLPTTESRTWLARLRALSESPSAQVEREMLAAVVPQAAPLPPSVLDAAARANALRLQRRALDAAAQGQPAEAARLLRAVAARLREHTGQTTRMGAKELTYSTRRLGRR
jgi:acyl-CoA reductase-like NAD-dependent aldehyde dehydrogenase